MKHFNPLQAAFYLIATVIGTELFLVVSASLSCIAANWYMPEMPNCGPGLRADLTNIVKDAIATAMAFSAGKIVGDKKDE